MSTIPSPRAATAGLSGMARELDSGSVEKSHSHFQPAFLEPAYPFSTASAGKVSAGNVSGSNAAMLDTTQPKAGGSKQSWLACIALAAPELKILVGLILIITALGMAWMTRDGLEASWLAEVKVPLSLSAFALIAFAPPLVLNFRSNDAQWRFMSAMLGIGWRSAFSTLALVYLMLSRTGQDFLLSSGLVACYFPLLVLQSWLLTRQAKRL